MSHVLVVDDEPAICWGFRELLKGQRHEVTTASSAEEALQIAAAHPPDAIILDVRLPGMDGLTALPELRRKSNEAPVVVITAFGNLDTAVQAIEEGAFDYITKPFELDDAAVVIRRALDYRAVQQAETDRSATSAASQVQGGDPADLTDHIVGASPAMQTVFKQIALLAQGEAPVLITGESGTGKELVARAIHRHSSRANEPFLPASLAAMTPASAESELFGHVKGAFPGATAARRGILELAGGGTILLDEIADASIALQLKLLRAIERQEIQPVGAATPVRGHFRVIAATNRDLGTLIEQGSFREDLFYRLSVVEIQLPPLRDRAEDIPDLARHFLRLNSGDRPPADISSAALLELCSRPWPGNVRELRNAIDHAAMMSRGGTIDTEHLPRADASIRRSAGRNETLEKAITNWAETHLAPLDATDSEADLYEDFLNTAERPLLNAVLKHCHDNRAAAARLLGLHRATLRQKLKKQPITGESAEATPGSPGQQ